MSGRLLSRTRPAQPTCASVLHRTLESADRGESPKFLPMNTNKFVPLSKPAAIRDQEWPRDVTPLVSISCITFNHVDYIHDCLQGFLMQETTFPVEILIHDDASTDGTADIIREYAEAFPELIKPILQTENQYSQGKPTSSNNYRRARGQYVAICEGDDYWVDPRKLEKQVIALEKHPDIDLSIHSAYQIDYKTGVKSVIGRHREESGIVGTGSVITREKGVIPTASSLVRRSVLSDLLAFKEARPYLMVGDIYLHFFGSKRGGAYYLDEPMSTYRARVPGSWNERVFANPEGRMKSIATRLKSYHELDKLTNYRYTADFGKANAYGSRSIIRSGKFHFLSLVRFYFSVIRYLRFRDALLHGALVAASPFLPKRDR
jgi:glycosyltransferase involved in cell wall biosynthesis